MLKQKIEKKLDEIINVFMKNPDVNQSGIGLLGGSVGTAYFLFHASRYYDRKDIYNTAFKIFEASLLSISSKNFRYCSLSSGLAGIGWAAEKLAQDHLIDFDTDEFLSEFDHHLSNQQISWLREGLFDFMHYGGGIFLYMLVRLQGDSKQSDVIIRYINAAVDALLSAAEEDGHTIKWQSPIEHEKKISGYNVSVSHGMTALLVIFSKIISDKRIPSNDRLISAYEKLKTYILSQRLDVKQYGSHFPTWSLESQKELRHSRLAWCYGDLGIARSLLICGLNTNDNELISIALTILSHNLKRKDVESTGVVDASLCHGSSGVALCFMLAEEAKYQDGVEYWLNKTLELMEHPDGLAGYKYFSPSEVPLWVNRTCILEGVSGVGLSFLNFLRPLKPGWNSFLLLS